MEIQGDEIKLELHTEREGERERERRERYDQRCSDLRYGSRMGLKAHKMMPIVGPAAVSGTYFGPRLWASVHLPSTKVSRPNAGSPISSAF